MATIKVLLRENRIDKAGEAPLALRITYNRKSTFVFLGHRLEPKFWDDEKLNVKKSHPNSTRLNNFIAKKLSDVQNYILQQEEKKESLNFELLKSKVTNRPNKKNGFKKVALDYLSELEAMELFTRLGPDRSRINHFLDFVNGDILFEQITLAKLEKFKVYLKTTYKHSDRTVFNHMVLLRTLFNRAIKYDIVDLKYYPFGSSGYVMKRPQAEKIGLEAGEIKKIEGYFM